MGEIIRREENSLYGKHEGVLPGVIGSNIGVPQGIPISALLYIIYADNITKGSKTEMSKNEIETIRHNEKYRSRMRMGKIPNINKTDRIQK